MPEDVITGSPRRTRSSFLHAATALGLSVFFPGCGHIFMGQFRRGVVWSLLFLVMVLPAWIFTYVLWSPASSGEVLWLVVLLFSFLFASGVEPVLAARRAHGPGGSGRKRLPTWVLGSYAAALAIGTGLEFTVFLMTCFQSAIVRTSSLQPLVSRGASVTVLLSSYVRPVHGDIVLFGLPATGQSSPGPGENRLGRVLAKPSDSLGAAGGKLIVNGLELALDRCDQRRALEKAGRGQRRRRLLSPVPYLTPGKTQVGKSVCANDLDWTEGEWGPYVLPGDLFLVLPDAESETAGDPRDPRRPCQALLVPKERLLGRVING